MRINVAPKMLYWARQRAMLDIHTLINRFPKINDWEQGKAQPTLKQLEAFAKTTHLPLGIFFLPEPPQEQLPIPDFRTIGSIPYDQPSPDLLETVYLCQQRQEWYSDYTKIHRATQLNFVGSVTVDADITRVAADIRQTMHFDIEQRGQARTWTEALRLFVNQVEKQGILVMASGVVGSNNKRKLDPEEFRGFVLVDKLSPLIFINTSDTKAAQMFTLAHEMAHIWLGASGVSNMLAAEKPKKQVERWCNQVAAELLVPLDDFRNTYVANEDLQTEMERLARRYKVSTLVVLRRIFDLGAISREIFWEAWDAELDRLKKIDRSRGDGGNFYRTLGVRVSKRFASALVGSTLEGQTLFRDAFQMLGIKKSKTFYEIAKKLGAER